MIEFILNGGIIFYIILLISIAAIALIVERGWFYFTKRNIDKNLLNRVLEGVKNNRLDEVYEFEKKNASPEWLVLKRGLYNINADREKLNYEMEKVANEEMRLLEKNLSFLSNIANISTLLGLLGTVTGMIISFFNMKVSGVSDPAVLAGGIAQALVTTAAGLTVAIPSLFFYHFFSQIVNEHAQKMEIFSAEFMNFVMNTRIW